MIKSTYFTAVLKMVTVLVVPKITNVATHGAWPCKTDGIVVILKAAINRTVLWSLNTLKEKVSTGQIVWKLHLNTSNIHAASNLFIPLRPHSLMRYFTHQYFRRIFKFFILFIFSFFIFFINLQEVSILIYQMLNAYFKHILASSRKK